MPPKEFTAGLEQRPRAPAGRNSNEQDFRWFSLYYFEHSVSYSWSMAGGYTIREKTGDYLVVGQSVRGLKTCP